MSFSVRRWLVLLWAILIAAVGVVSAQDEGVDDPYADISQSRAEDGAFVLGEPDAPLTVIEFADFLCPHCQTYTEVSGQFIDQYVRTGQAKFQFRMVPIVDQELSPTLAALAECAGDEGLFWPAHDILFELAEQQQLDPDVISERLGLDIETLTECVRDANQYQIDTQLANELAVTGTPAIRVQVGDGKPGALSVGSTVFESGGVPLEALASFVESENPGDMVVLLNQLRDDRLLQDTSLVTGEPCSAPCWRDIIPGETNWDAAVEIIQSDDQFENVNVEESSQSDAQRVTWGQVEGDLCCVTFTRDGETVTFILLKVAPEVTVEEVIESHGEPTYLTGIETDRDQARLILFYPQVPMLVEAFVVGAEEGALTEESEIVGVQYLTEEDMEQILATNPLHEWEGFQSYLDYMEGEFELTPEAGS